MSMWGDYIKEHRGDEIIENEQGFASYRRLPDRKAIYIVDIYIKPEFRKTKAASAIADEVVGIAIKEGCTQLLGSVVPFGKNATASLKVLLAYGFELESATADLIVFKKDIYKWVR